MNSKNIVILTILFWAFALEMLAQRDSIGVGERTFYGELNRINNPLGSTISPIRLSYNEVRDMAIADVYYAVSDGDYKAINAGDGVNAFGVSVDGLMTFKDLSVEGGMRYDNAYEKNQAWGIELYSSEHNPFVLSNPNAGDRRIEEFDLYAGVSYEIKRWTLGLRLEYLTGAMSDRVDPRAETSAMRFEATPGVMVKLAKNFSMGLSGLVGQYNSQTSHTVVNNMMSYTYYLMKGNGNYEKRSTSDHYSYPREYNGMRYQGALQFLAGGAEKRVSNMTELWFEANKEISLDGDDNLIYRSGDFHSKQFGVKNHAIFGKTDKVRHSLLIDASMELNSGFWYDQKRVVDTEHGNMNSYEILQYYKLNSSTYLNGALTYNIDVMTGQGMPNYGFMIKGGYASYSQEQNDGLQFKESYDHYMVGLDAKKHWTMGRCRLSTTIAGDVKMNLSDPMLDAKTTEISDIYTNPRFAYASSEKFNVSAIVCFSAPIATKKRDLILGVELDGGLTYMIGDSSFYAFTSNNNKHIDVYVFLNF